MHTGSRKKVLDQTYEALVTEISQFEHSFNSSKSLLRGKTFIETTPYLDVQPAYVRRSLRRPKLRADSPNEVSLLHRLPLIAPSRLGPGSYQAETTRTALVASFEKAPRFPVTFQERIATYRPHVRQLSSGERKEVALRIQTNIAAIKRYTPDERLKTLREKAAMEETRLSLTRSFRTELASLTHRKREEDLQTKLRRFQWRMNPAAISKGKRKWVGLFCGFSAMSKWQSRFISRKILHLRSEKVLKFLLVMCISIGRIRLLVSRNRRKKAFATLRKLVPFLTHWRRKHRKELVERVAETLEMATSRQTIYKLIGLWKRRVMLT